MRLRSRIHRSRDDRCGLVRQHRTENRRNSFLRNPEAMENVSADDGMQVTDSTSRHDTTFLI